MRRAAAARHPPPRRARPPKGPAQALGKALARLLGRLLGRLLRRALRRLLRRAVLLALLQLVELAPDPLALVDLGLDVLEPLQLLLELADREVADERRHVDRALRVGDRALEGDGRLLRALVAGFRGAQRPVGIDRQLRHVERARGEDGQVLAVELDAADMQRAARGGDAALHGLVGERPLVELLDEAPGHGLRLDRQPVVGRLHHGGEGARAHPGDRAVAQREGAVAGQARHQRERRPAGGVEVERHVGPPRRHRVALVLPGELRQRGVRQVEPRRHAERPLQHLQLDRSAEPAVPHARRQVAEGEVVAVRDEVERDVAQRQRAPSSLGRRELQGDRPAAAAGDVEGILGPLRAVGLVGHEDRRHAQRVRQQRAEGDLPGLQRAAQARRLARRHDERAVQRRDAPAAVIGEVVEVVAVALPLDMRGEPAGAEEPAQAPQARRLEHRRDLAEVERHVRREPPLRARRPDRRAVGGDGGGRAVARELERQAVAHRATGAEAQRAFARRAPGALEAELRQQHAGVAVRRLEVEIEPRRRQVRQRARDVGVALDRRAAGIAGQPEGGLRRVAGVARDHVERQAGRRQRALALLEERGDRVVAEQMRRAHRLRQVVRSKLQLHLAGRLVAELAQLAVGRDRDAGDAADLEPVDLQPVAREPGLRQHVAGRDAGAHHLAGVEVERQVEPARRGAGEAVGDGAGEPVDGQAAKVELVGLQRQVEPAAAVRRAAVAAGRVVGDRAGQLVAVRRHLQLVEGEALRLEPDRRGGVQAAGHRAEARQQRLLPEEPRGERARVLRRDAHRALEAGAVLAGKDAARDGDVGVAGEHGLGARDAPAARVEHQVGAEILDDVAADDERADVDGQPPVDRHEPGVDEPRQRGHRVVGRDRAVGPAAERAVDVDLARRQHRLETRLAADLDMGRPAQRDRMLVAADPQPELLQHERIGRGLRGRLEAPVAHVLRRPLASRRGISAGRAVAGRGRRLAIRRRRVAGRRRLGRRHDVLQRDRAVILRLVALVGERSVEHELHRPRLGLDGRAEPHRAVGLAAPERHLEPVSLPAEIGAALELVGPEQARGGAGDVEAPHRVVRVAARVVDHQHAVGHREMVDLHLLRGDRHEGGLRLLAPRHEAVRADAEAQLRPLQGQLGDVDLAAQERHEAAAGRQRGDALAAALAADMDVAGAQHRERHEPHLEVPVDRDRPADHLARLLGDVAAILVPVDHKRHGEGGAQEQRGRNADRKQKRVHRKRLRGERPALPVPACGWRGAA